MSNILKAFINITNNYKVNIQNLTRGNNRANNMGEGLETFVQDSFANTFNKKSFELLSKTYSYQGNKNNPPDLILRNSDAIEIKKIESKNSAIALNSSYPKAKIYALCCRIYKKIYIKIFVDGLWGLFLC